MIIVRYYWQEEDLSTDDNLNGTVGSFVVMSGYGSSTPSLPSARPTRPSSAPEPTDRLKSRTSTSCSQQCG
ncbi:MAG TPA: hypothetical protein PLI05_07230 [Methanotrichaceae archaeon]|nr:hypothetical protein [Methanotrichaceae archaeon]HQF16842.1 hypothetical protein [Methanotrichaceae archaeon]HQI90168.1 hypothetical protein [Methanotrichaceae archaeon]HQJ29110.1 hypothetical protein [Methanotrichaceae archaeon]